MRRRREQLRLIKRATARRVASEDLLTSLPNASPGFIEPMHCKLVDHVPVGDQWHYELKLDGYRALAIKTTASVRLISRNKKDLTGNYPEIVKGVKALSMDEGVLDGEIVAVDSGGKPSFQALQHAAAPRREPRPIYFFAFDLLNLDCKDLTRLPLLERKRLLQETLHGAPAQVRFARFLEGEPQQIWTEICDRHLEGIVAKVGSSRYEPGKRNGAWVKVKCGHEQEFVIGGYTQGKDKRASLGALIVGYYDRGKLRYASKVGTGFTNRQIREFLDRAKPLRQPQSPFDSVPESSGSSWSYGLTAIEWQTAVWLKPVLVCQVRFTEWTQDGHLRHPAFLGFREDKAASEVVRERAGSML